MDRPNASVYGRAQMHSSEIRAIRGSLSRAAFARRLGVTTLTVLRWELPEGSKEARRPRAKMIELLRSLASEGVGLEPDLAESEADEDEDASEPTVERTDPAVEAPETDVESALDPDVARWLTQLHTESWERAEDALLSLLAASTTTPAARTLATLGLVEVQILARLDVRGALATLLPILDEAARGGLSRALAARAHLVAALLFGAPDSRVYDPGRLNVHIAEAAARLDPDDDDLQVLLAVARLASARFVGPHALASAYDGSAARIERARSPLATCLVGEMRAMMARIAGDYDAAARFEASSLATAIRLRYGALALVMLADRAYLALRGPFTPERVLGITAEARGAARELAPSEAMLRILAAECEALSRLGRLRDADVVLREAVTLAERAALPLHALAATGARLFMLQARGADLAELADRVASAEANAGPRGALVEQHALLCRAAGLLPHGAVRAAELLERCCESIVQHAGRGAEHIDHDAFALTVLARALGNDLPGAERALRRAEKLLARRPSLWHEGWLLRMQAQLLVHAGRAAESTQKLSAALSIFERLGDVVQRAEAKLDLALVQKAVGAPAADGALRDAHDELACLGIVRSAPLAAMQPRAPATTGPLDTPRWTELVAGAVERLTVRGLPPEHVQRELSAVLTELFPGRGVMVEHSDGDALDHAPPGIGAWTDVCDGVGGRLRCGLVGEVDDAQRAVLRTLLAVAALRLETSRARTLAHVPALEVDPVLPGFIAAAPATRQLRREIAQLARSRANILVTGESGSGKEVVARALHDLSGRANNPFTAFNCASVPRDLFEGQLFGYRKGAFTGAAADSPGVIRAASTGTLFLDEIGELPLDTQPKLLRFLENGEIFPLGEHKPRRVDVRVVAATHRDLGRLVREGAFREDLYYRLNVVPVVVPPLRDRREDIVPLARAFLARLAPEGSEPSELGADAIAALKAHSWPGNVRELRNVLERALAYAPSQGILRAEHLRITRVPTSMLRTA